MLPPQTLLLAAAAAFAFAVDPMHVAGLKPVQRFGSTPIPSRGTLVEVTSGWVWNENLAFAGGALWMSDAMTGELRRAVRNADGTYNVTVHFAKNHLFVNIAGVVGSADGTTLYAAAHSVANDTHLIIATPTSAAGAGVFSVVATLPCGPSSCVKGNGLRIFNGVLYVSAEGDWLPGGGWLFSVDTRTRAVTQMSQGNLWAADGLWISSKGALYCGQLFSRELWRVPLPGPNGTISPGPTAGGWLDDFTLDEAAGGGVGLFTGANWLDGRADQWWPNGTALAPLITNLTNPTSVRWGVEEEGFPATSLFISEGGGLLPWQTTQRTWELRNARD